jgi:hypothetical protein
VGKLSTLQDRERRVGAEEEVVHVEVMQRERMEIVMLGRVGKQMEPVRGKGERELLTMRWRIVMRRCRRRELIEREREGRGRMMMSRRISLDRTLQGMTASYSHLSITLRDSTFFPLLPHLKGSSTHSRWFRCEEAKALA